MTKTEEQPGDAEREAEIRLRMAARESTRAAAQSAVAKARLAATIRETKDTLSRRRAAASVNLTPGRIQQIIDADPVELEKLEAELSDTRPLGVIFRERREELDKTIAEMAAELEVLNTALRRFEQSTDSEVVDSEIFSRYLANLLGTSASGALARAVRAALLG